MYGHCHLNGNNSVTTASATAVKVEGLNRKSVRNGEKRAEEEEKTT